MSDSPAFSIIIPTLNEESCLPQLLSDLSLQSFRDFEVIVVDAQSEDKTVQQAKKLRSKLPKLSIVTSIKRNVSIQRNLGAKSAHSDWFLFMDADNRVPSYFLQGIKYRIEENPSDIFFTYFVPDSTNPSYIAMARITNLYFSLQKNSTKPSLPESMVGIHKKVFNACGGFPENITFGEGGAFANTAVKHGYKLNIFKDPKYSYSFRRYRKNTLLTAPLSAVLELARLIDIELDEKTLQKLYPMKGGKTHDQVKTKYLENFIKEVSREIKSNRPKSLKELQQKLKHRLYQFLE